MTRRPTPDPAAPVTSAPTPAASPAGAGAAACAGPHPLPEGAPGVAATAGLPRFLPYAEETPTRVECTWNCVVCREYSVVDAATRLCRPCWRFVILAPAAMRRLRDGT